MTLSFDNSKDLKFVFTLGTGNFGSSSSGNTVTLQGFRAVVDIDKAGGAMMGTLRASIFGVKQSEMNSLTTIQWQPLAFIPNTVQIFAVDGDQTTLVFVGNIVNAWANYDNMPDVYLSIRAQAAYFSALQPITPTAFSGPTDAVSLMQIVIGKINASINSGQPVYTFENNGVPFTPIKNPYYANTGLEQLKDIARDNNIWLYVDNTIIAITPVNQPRIKFVPIISQTSGLKGYPTFDGVGVKFQMLFSPSVTFGGSVQILSPETPRAEGPWIVTSLSLKLESAKPNGSWLMDIRGSKTGLALSS
jgi:hypothetical protein